MMMTEFAVSTDSNRPSRDTIRSETATQAIVQLVAELEDVSPAELPPLGESIDTDSLNYLIRSSRAREAYGPCRITLQYEGYGVTVRSSATIEIRDADGSRPADRTPQ